MLKTILQRVSYSIGLRLMKIPRQLYHNYRANQIKDKNVSLMCNNCFGAQVLHDMKMRFNSPCVNLAFDFKDYVEFLSNLKHYLTLDIEEVVDSEVNYPIGRFVGTDTIIKFMHYDSFENACELWYKRRSRIIWDKVYVLCELKSLPSPQENAEDYLLLRKFLDLPYKKAIITSSNQEYRALYPNVVFEVPYFNDYFWGKALSWSRPFALKRNTDFFDYVSFFNQ